MLPAPTARLRFREMTDDDLDEMTAVLGAPDPARPTRRRRTRADAERWIAWNIQNYAELGHGLWVVETHDGAFVGDCGLTIQDVEGEPFVEVGYHVKLELAAKVWPRRPPPRSVTQPATRGSRTSSRSSGRRTPRHSASPRRSA